MSVPTGYSQSTALRKVRRLSNEPNLPADGDVIDFLNDGLEQITNELKILRNVWNEAIGAGAAELQLPGDIYIIDRITWSTTLPTTPGCIEWPLQELGPGAFTEQTGGMPTQSGGVEVWYRTLIDEAQQITLQFFPLIPTAGYINVYGRQRATLWDPANGGSTTNVDSSVQMLAIYWAVVCVCENRENYVKAKYYQDKLDGLVAQARVDVQQRQKPRGSVVRDVTSGPMYQPSWMPRS